MLTNESIIYRMLRVAIDFARLRWIRQKSSRYRRIPLRAFNSSASPGSTLAPLAYALNDKLISNALILTVLCLATNGLSNKILIEGTAALVGETLITVQDARFYRSMIRFKDGEPQVLSVEGSEELKRTVQKIGFEEMVFAELQSLKLEASDVSLADKVLDAELAKPGRRKVWNSILSTYGRTDREGRERLGKSLQVEKFLQKKVETLTPVVSDLEAERYFREHKSKYPGKSADAAKSEILSLLKREGMHRSLEEWVVSLRQKYGFKVLLESKGSG